MAEENKKKASFLKAVSLAWDLGYIIAIPLVVLAISGRLLDKKFDSSPVLLLTGIILAMIISGVLTFRKTKKILDDVKK
jgi:F0F1-type ATP synthase assembly protein I